MLEAHEIRRVILSGTRRTQGKSARDGHSARGVEAFCSRTKGAAKSRVARRSYFALQRRDLQRSSISLFKATESPYTRTNVTEACRCTQEITKRGMPMCCSVSEISAWASHCMDKHIPFYLLNVNDYLIGFFLAQIQL